MSSHTQAEIIGFPVSVVARDTYQFPDPLFAPNGKSNIANFHAARLFAQYMNRQRNVIIFPERAVRASQINAVAIIHGITQYLFQAYCEEHPALFDEAFAHLNEQIADIDGTLHTAVDEFPPLDVRTGQQIIDEYLQDSTQGRRNRDIVLEELVMLWMANINPAFNNVRDLFDDSTLEAETDYEDIIDELQTFFDSLADDERFSGSFTGGLSIFEFLMAPIKASPHSLEGQLQYMYTNWGSLLGAFAHRLLRSLDFIQEETKAIFTGPGPSTGPAFDGLGDEARFTADRDWMPNLVLMAKNAYVWLDQLSKAYGRDIKRLDQIPDEELDKLAGWGFTGLWLIGLWERSPASQKIKQLCGNPEAVASAYSLYEYKVADDLGGEEASNNLKERAWQRGIRLASDMVPNHFGLDSKAVIENPEWFLSLDYSPFPSYTFNGPNVSTDPRVGIYIEDHYYDRSDAAVVFKRVDHHTGDTRYIYHGNDGTSMPWNDTAQLNYLDPNVREAMIQIILDVARQFPVIRFDAAMTLAKKHVQRLWFPEPGAGGAIASRSEHGMTKAEFDQHMPKEFWREVVDRVLEEVPDTLLLAEAFWLMEGYFVRTLGMHRVYNSAFMHMLRDEDNQKYRIVIKDTLEFDPDILKRYVNFMNNPDERTAIDQFGTDDKYFGIATLLATLPGLPMFGHGQVEGFSEKYGMEYRRAYQDEHPNEGLIARHEAQIFPLLRKRYLFAGAENFLLYDFNNTEGGVNEDVFAYSNRVGDERSLVVYHNRYADARGWLRMSTAYLKKDSDSLFHQNLGEGLALPYDEGMYCIFRDQRTGLEYIRNCKALHEQGLYIELGAYACHVFLDFRIVSDWAGQYHHLADSLNGQGVPNMDEALQAMQVRPVLEPFQALVNADTLRHLLEVDITEEEEAAPLLDNIEERLRTLLQAIEHFLHERDSAYTLSEDRSTAEILATQARTRLHSLLELANGVHSALDDIDEETNDALALESKLAVDAPLWGGLMGWGFVHQVGAIASEDYAHQYSRSWLDDWLFGRVIQTAFEQLGYDNPTRLLTAIKVVTTHHDLLNDEAAPADILEALLNDGDGRAFLNVNRYEGVVWFNQEGWNDILLWLLLVSIVKTDDVSEDQIDLLNELYQAGEESEFKIATLESLLAEETE